MLNTIEKRKESHELNDSEFNRYMSLKDDIAIYNKQINEIENSNDELDYLVNTGSILFKYYDIVDNGTSNDDMAITSSVKQNSILKFFVNTSPTENDIENDMEDRATLSEQYMAYINDNYTKINVEEKDKCSCCESTDRSVMTNDGLIYCNSCNTVEYIIVDHDRPSYKDPPREISYFHKRTELKSSGRRRTQGYFYDDSLNGPCEILSVAASVRMISWGISSVCEISKLRETLYTLLTFFATKVAIYSNIIKV